MIYNLYKALKRQIAPVAGVEGVEWFKAQYEGQTGSASHVYIECLPLVTTRDNKALRQTAIQIRIHIVSAANNQTIREITGEAIETAPDILLENHDALAQRILNAVDGLSLPFGRSENESKTRPLELSGWSYQHKYTDWLVTQIELKTRG